MMNEKHWIDSFLHYRTDIGDGVRTGLCFRNCSSQCKQFCLPKNSLREHDYFGDSLEQKEYSVKELLRYLEEEKKLMPSQNLGITFMGQEPLLDYWFCRELAQGISDLGMSLQIYTCGLCDPSDYKSISDWCDLFYFRMFSPIAGIRPPIANFDFERVWSNLMELEYCKIPYRLLIPVVKGLNVGVADGFSGLATQLHSLKSVVLDFSHSGFCAEEIEEFRYHFLKRCVVLY